MNYKAGHEDYDYWESKMDVHLNMYTGGRMLNGVLLRHYEDQIFITGNPTGETMVYKININSVGDFSERAFNKSENQWNK